METKSNLLLTGKCFSLTNFPNDKQTQKSLKSDFLKITFRETNMLLDHKKSLKSDFLKITFRETNMPLDHKKHLQI
jgi:hypothetical protein